MAKKKFTCKFPNCDNSYIHSKTMDMKNLRFHRFPKDPERLLKWKKACGINLSVKNCANLRNQFVCRDHFETKDYLNKDRLHLNHMAVPHFVEVLNDLVPVQLLENVTPENEIYNHCVSPTNEYSARHSDHHSSNVNQDDFNNLDRNVFPTLDVDYSTLNTRINEMMEAESIVENAANEVPLESSVSLKSKSSARKGILTKVGMKRKELTPQKKEMYKIHRNTVSQLCKVKRRLFEVTGRAKELKQLYDTNTFKIMEEQLNAVTKNFIDSQLRNVGRVASGKRWTEEDKAFALSVYKRSPRLYRYLSVFFEFPSTRTLKHILSNVPFDTGINTALLNHLKVKINKMGVADRCCALMFDEMSLSNDFYYDSVKEQIVGYEDLGEYGRSNKAANHVLVLMIRGIKSSWKQIIGYYFTAATIGSDVLKNILTNSIEQLQHIGLNVMATICDQGSTQRKAVTELCKAKQNDPTPFTFIVNNQPIVTIYDVPHLLKCTRNSLLRCNLHFDKNKTAKFEYIQRAFEMDQEKDLHIMYNLKEEYFNFKDSYMKMKVKIAAAQLGHTSAAAIKTFCAAGWLPLESVWTAEFVKNMDSLFDSLNGYTVVSR